MHRKVSKVSIWIVHRNFTTNTYLNIKLHTQDYMIKIYLDSDHAHRAPWSPALSEICPAVTRDDWCCPSRAGHVQGPIHTCHIWPVSEPGVKPADWPLPQPSGCRGSSASNALFSERQREHRRQVIIRYNTRITWRSFYRGLMGKKKCHNHAV